MKFIQAATSSDIYSLGLILHQIATGYPTQMELPIKLKCKTIKDEIYITYPQFGFQTHGTISMKHVGLTIKHQERFGKHLQSFIKKSENPYGLYSDPEFI